MTALDSERGTILITGGAGFIGTNLAHRLLCDGWPVVVYDNLSRSGVKRNAAWLRRQHGNQVNVLVEDIRDSQALRRCLLHSAPIAGVFHFAAQVAVTTSLIDPWLDFTVNAGGTLNLLNALRELDQPPPLLFTSTNKVYGGLNGLGTRRVGERYEPVDATIAANGIAESQPLDFHSPYGCSKGAADQYVLDYARSYGIPSVVFRMSCIYGPHQFGTEDQGWVAHFLLRALAREPITLYGDGCQVRDVLFVGDLVQAQLLAFKELRRQRAGEPSAQLAGHAFNMGGGPARSISLLELLDLIGSLQGRRSAVTFGDWRQGDQRYYVSDTSKFSAATGWTPRVDVREGVARLYTWLMEQQGSAHEDSDYGDYLDVVADKSDVLSPDALAAPLSLPLAYSATQHAVIGDTLVSLTPTASDDQAQAARWRQQS